MYLVFYRPHFLPTFQEAVEYHQKHVRASSQERYLTRASEERSSLRKQKMSSTNMEHHFGSKITKSASLTHMSAAEQANSLVVRGQAEQVRLKHG